MLSKEQSLQIAKEEISKLKDDTEFVILEDQTLEKRTGWIFRYTTKEYYDTGDESRLIPGMVPIFVNKMDGSFKFITVFDKIE